VTFAAWRRIHRAASASVAAIALLHMGLTAPVYGAWSPAALWFFSAGLGLLLLAVVNWAHVGLAPCQLPTAPVVRWANVGYVLLGVAALVAVREAQALLLMASLAIQAVASHHTLRGAA